MKKLKNLLSNFITDYKKSMDIYGSARITICENINISKSKNNYSLNNYIKFQHGSTTISPE